MFKVLQTFNLFPYPHLWRVGKEQYHSDKCSIVMSIFIMLIVGGLFAQRLVSVFKMQTITAISQTLVSSSPPPTVVRTFQGHEQTKPFMLAFNLYSANPQLNASDPSFQLSAYVDHIHGGIALNRTDYNQTISLEACTPSHFPTIDNIETQFIGWGASSWLCLPVNKSYTIQGSWNLDGTYSSINFLFNCTGACHSTLQTLNIQFYLLSSIVNPHNNTQPEQYFIEEITIPLKRIHHLQYSYDLTQNIIKTDQSIFPWSKDNQTHSIKPEQFKQVVTKDSTNQSVALFYFQRSARTITLTRSYMKLLDAVSYVGGMFEAIIGIFFFMLIFARIFYQFKFAGKYFRTPLAKDFGVKNLVQQLGFKFLKKIHCEPQWKIQQERQEMQKTVNYLLDVVYLHKRIDFLQKAISVLLEDHQLKGIHLIHDLTVDEAKDNFKQHQLRDNLVSYLHDRSKDIDYALKNQDYFRWSLFQREYFKDIQNMITGQQLNKEEMNQDGGVRRQIQQTSKMERELPEINRGGLEKKSSSRRKREKDKIKQYQKEQELPPRKGSISSANSISISKDFLRPEDDKLGDLSLYRNTSTLQDNFLMLRQSYADLGELNIQFNETDLRKQLESDLQRLIDEADAPDGDIRSKKIYGNLDNWMKTMLKTVVKPARRMVTEKEVRKGRMMDQGNIV